MARSPFSLSRLLKITPEGKVLYKADKEHCHPFPEPASEDLFGGVSRNFQVFEPLDFLAELTQHIPNKGEHLIRYYGCYSNKARGVSAKKATADATQVSVVENGPSPLQSPSSNPDAPQISNPQISNQASKMRWAMLIKRIYHTDPLLCPKCGGTMKIISFIEARQEEVIRKILEHCGLWHDPPMRAPPVPAANPQRARSVSEGPANPRRQFPLNLAPPSAPGLGYEVDPDFIEHAHREQNEQFELPWEP